MANTMRARMGQTINELIERDQRVVLVLADISTTYFERAAAAHPNRVINVGIMEQTAVSVAAGFALEGFLPIVHSITPFVVERPFEQIKDDLCYQRLGATLISIGASYDYGTDGMTHHGTGDVPILKTLPRMEIVVPGTAAEFDSLLRETYVGSAPTYIRLSERQNGLDRPVRFGRLHIEREGRDAVVVAVGPLLDVTLEAVADLDVTVLYATTVTPFDGETLRSAVATTGKSIVLVEPYYEGTLVPEVVAAVAPTPVRVEAIGVPRKILDRYGTAERHDAEIGLTPAGIRSRVERFLLTGRNE